MNEARRTAFSREPLEKSLASHVSRRRRWCASTRHLDKEFAIPEHMQLEMTMERVGSSDASGKPLTLGKMCPAHVQEYSLVEVVVC